MKSSFKMFFNSYHFKKIWCRVDDICENNDSFKKLIALHDRRQVPLTLSIIPDKLSNIVRDEILKRPLCTVIQHGYSHINYGTQDNPSEFSNNRPIIDMIDELLLGKEILKNNFPEQFIPIFVPPWHNISLSLMQILNELGFSAISLNHTQHYPLPNILKRFDVHIDPIKWHPTPKFKEWQNLSIEIELCMKKNSSDSHLGIVAHPHSHDEACWEFFENLFQLTNIDWLFLNPKLEIK